MTSELLMEQYVVYAHPRDFPQGYVVRRWFIVRGSREPIPEERACGFFHLDKARAWIAQARPGLTCLARYENDDPAVLEVWL